MNLLNLHALWRTCKAVAASSAPDSVQETFVKLHPKASKVQQVETLQLGRLLSLYDKSSSRELTTLGSKFAKSEHWKTWRPSEAQAETLKAKGMIWQKTQETVKRKKILDLFCGAGGLGLGFEMAGFATAIAVDNDKQALQAHEANFPNCQAVSGDIHEIGSDPKSKFDPLLGRGNGTIAGVVGGPPCQGFSYIGERVVKDERNMLTSRFLDVVITLQPDFFVMENVAGLLTSGTRPRFMHHLAQYSKSIGPAASTICANLPNQPNAPNRRERQYNKRLVSSAVSAFQKSLTHKSNPKSLLSDVRYAYKKLNHHLTEAFSSSFIGASRELALSQLKETENSQIVIAVATIVCRYASRIKKTSDTEAQKMVETLAQESSTIGEVCRHLLESYFNLEPASNYKGVSVGPVLRHLIDRASMDYIVTPPRILSAAWFGAPQDRRRLFLIGIHKRLNKAFSFPTPTHRMDDEKFSLFRLKSAVTCEEAIGNLPDVDRYPQLLEGDQLHAEEIGVSKSDFAAWMGGEQIPDEDLSLPRETWDPFVVDCCKRTTHSAHVLDRLQNVSHGVLDSTSGKTRLKPHDVAHTLRAGTREAMGSHTAVRPIHYTFNRVITVREGARLMGYPDWMTFHPTKWHGFRLVGNGVPAQLGRAIALAIKQQIYTEQEG